MCIHNFDSSLLFANSLKGFIGIFNESSEYLFLNEEGADWLGFSSAKSGLTKTHADINCRAKALADEWFFQDQQTFTNNSPQKFIGFHCFANDNWRFIMGQKTVLSVPEYEKPFIFCQISELPGFASNELIRLTLEYSSQKVPFQLRQFSMSLKQDGLASKLTDRQGECLFFLLRGKTAKEIGIYLNISYRTIEAHLIELKHVFNCENKSQLVEKAISNGYLNYMPPSLFSTHFPVNYML